MSLHVLSECAVFSCVQIMLVVWLSLLTLGHFKLGTDVDTCNTLRQISPMHSYQPGQSLLCLFNLSTQYSTGAWLYLLLLAPETKLPLPSDLSTQYSTGAWLYLLLLAPETKLPPSD